MNLLHFTLHKYTKTPPEYAPNIHTDPDKTHSPQTLECKPEHLSNRSESTPKSNIFMR